MPSAWSFAARGDGSDTLEIDVFGFVGPGEHWFGGISASSLNRLLKANKDAKTIKMRINSEGGDVIDGFAVYDQLVAHPAAVEIDIIGVAASMATVLAMAASPGKLRMSSNAWFMIHNPWGMQIGEAEDMRRWADVLDKMGDQAAAAYESRTPLSIQEIKSMMSAETWMTAAEAKAKGFVDVVTNPTKAKAKASARAFAALRDFSNVPRELLEQFGSQAQQMTLPPVADDPGDNHREQEDEMDKDTQTLLALLGVAALADATTRIASLLRVEAVTGKTGDEAHGVALAHKSSHEKYAALQAENADLKKKTDAQELDQLIATAKAANKLTPAEETTLREQVASGGVSLTGAKAMLETKAANTVLAAAAARNSGAPAVTGSTATQPNVALTWNGKTWAQLKGPERAALLRENPELYAQMRDAALPLS